MQTQGDNSLQNSRYFFLVFWANEAGSRRGAQDTRDGGTRCRLVCWDVGCSNGLVYSVLAFASDV